MADDADGRHVVFVGAMGAGKTTIGRPVAAMLGRQFLDNDALLEEASGETAAELAERDGVDALHRAEAAIVLDALQRSHPAVIAAAASTITDANVRDALRRRAWVAWLRADHATLAARLPESSERPFRAADAARLVADQAAERDALFGEVADGTFETAGAPVDETVNALVRALKAAGLYT